MIDNDADNLIYYGDGEGTEPEGAHHHPSRAMRYAPAMRNSGADEVIIPEYEGGIMTGRMIAKFYPGAHPNLA